MHPVRVRLAPGLDETHTRLSTSLQLPRLLRAWELTDLNAAVKAWTGSRLLVALPADAPCDWLDEWSGVLADACAGGLDVAFVPGRPRRPDRHVRHF